MVICEVVTVINRKLTPITSAYLLPSTLDNLPDLEEALTLFRYHNPVVLVGLSANIGQYHNPQSQQVYYLMMEFGMVNLLLHFRQLCWYQHMKTWYRER